MLIVTQARGHLKKRRPPSIPSVHICTKKSSRCLHFGQSSLRLSYRLRGVSPVNSLLLWAGNSNIGSRNKSGPRGPSYTTGDPFLPPFPFPLSKHFLLGDPPDLATLVNVKPMKWRGIYSRGKVHPVVWMCKCTSKVGLNWVVTGFWKGYVL